MDILDKAIEFELQGNKFYLESAAKAKTKAVKNILENLAHDELEHAEFLGFLKNNQVDDFVPSKTLGKIGSILKESALNDPNFLQKDADVIHILHEALAIEDKARQHYTDEAMASLDEKSQKLLKLLALEEENHYKLIDNLIKFLDNPGNILESQEFNFYDE
jgi:rubrerythrin